MERLEPASSQKTENWRKPHPDENGSIVSVVKLDPESAYIGIPELLKNVIDESNKKSWSKICEKIDYIYTNLEHVFKELEKHTKLKEKICNELEKGKILLFKPNLVIPEHINPTTHGPAYSNSVCTEWPFIAALMRYFHDKYNITYHQMSLGETATLTSMFEGFYNMHYDHQQPITTEAIIEGRSGNFYGGWGFYFVRKYLAETHQPTHEDNPMNGYMESTSGTYLPPGKSLNKLMIYDLNRVSDIKGKARTVPVPDGENYHEITLHKAIVGGDQANPEDMADYPGCILINVPRLKMHSSDLLTNALKNLGLGLYPMEAAENNDLENPRWKYSYPNERTPGMKSEVPHQTWRHKLEDDTCFPVRDPEGNYIRYKSGGIAASQVDVIKATVSQDVFMIHISDAIQMVNISHTGSGVKVSEGLIFASLDPVAMDAVCARYCFKTVPIQEARKVRKKQGIEFDFLQRVPVPIVEGSCIVNEEGFDSPLLRYDLYGYAESRGLGQERYFVKGWDTQQSKPLCTMEGHLGWFDGETFLELMTSELYYNPGSIIWDLEKTITAYLIANDILTGSSYVRELYDTLDENNDGTIHYFERGVQNCRQAGVRIAGVGYHLQGTEKYGFLKGPFLSAASMRYAKKEWNIEGHDFLIEPLLIPPFALAYSMSKTLVEAGDPLFPEMTWGNGKWPSFQYVTRLNSMRNIFGSWN